MSRSVKVEVEHLANFALINKHAVVCPILKTTCSRVAQRYVTIDAHTGRRASVSVNKELQQSSGSSLMNTTGSRQHQSFSTHTHNIKHC